MRASFTVLLIVATIAVSGCSQTTTPTSPSAAVGGTSAATIVAGASAETSGTMAKINGPAPSTTVLLVCDSPANAQADFELYDSFGGTLLAGPIHLECGPDSLSGSRRDTVKVPTFADAGWAHVGVFTVQSVVSGGCAGDTAVPGTLECLQGSKKEPHPGATLTFK
jgi:hypothetical protein